MKKILIATLPILALIGCGEAISFETEGSYSISWGIIGVLAGLALAGLLTALAWRFISFIGSHEMIWKILKKDGEKDLKSDQSQSEVSGEQKAQAGTKENPYVANGNGKHKQGNADNEGCGKENCNNTSKKSKSLWDKLSQSTIIPYALVGLLAIVIVYLALASGS